MLSLIVAQGDNRVIGRQGGMPWHLSGDFKFFKATTMGKPVVMGRKTHQSIGRPLPGRTNIVVTRDPDFQAEGVELARDMAAALKLAAATGSPEIMVIGGAEIYRQALPEADRIYLTEVHLSPDGDAHFPALSAQEWREVSREARSETDQNGRTVDYDIVVLERNG